MSKQYKHLYCYDFSSASAIDARGYPNWARNPMDHYFRAATDTINFVTCIQTPCHRDGHGKTIHDEYVYQSDL